MKCRSLPKLQDMRPSDNQPVEAEFLLAVVLDVIQFKAMIVSMLKDVHIADPRVSEHEYCLVTPVPISLSSCDSFLCCCWCESLTVDTSCSLVMICKNISLFVVS